MEVWQIVLYAVASLLALRSLVALMAVHKNRLKREFYEREEQQRRQEQQKAKAEKEKEAAAKNKPRRNGTAA